MDKQVFQQFLEEGYSCLWENQIKSLLANSNDDCLPNYPQVELPMINLTHLVKKDKRCMKKKTCMDNNVRSYTSTTLQANGGDIKPDTEKVGTQHADLPMCKSSVSESYSSVTQRIVAKPQTSVCNSIQMQLLSGGTASEEHNNHNDFASSKPYEIQNDTHLPHCQIGCIEKNKLVRSCIDEDLYTETADQMIHYSIHETHTDEIPKPDTQCRNKTEMSGGSSSTDNDLAGDITYQLDDGTNPQDDAIMQIHQPSDADIQDTVSVLLRAQTVLSHIKPTDPCRDDIKWRRAQYAKEYELRKQLVGTSTSVSNETFREVYSRTGLQLDRRQQIVEECVTFLEQSIRGIVEFAKHIPGFSALTLADQSKLIKESKIESILLGFQRLSDEQHPSIVSTPWGMDYSLDELYKVFSDDDLRRCIRLTELIQKLKPTLSELALLRAISITASDRCELEDTEAVDKINLYLVDCLLHILNEQTTKCMCISKENLKPQCTCKGQSNKMSTGSGKRFAQIINIVLLLREISELNSRLLTQMCVEWPVAATHDLVKEFYT